MLTRVKWSLDGSLLVFYGGSSVVVWAVENEVRERRGRENEERFFFCFFLLIFLPSLLPLCDRNLLS